MSKQINSFLGRGLEALIPQRIYNPVSTIAVPEESDTEKIKEIDIDQIKVNPYQPRQHFDAGKIYELIESVREHGIIQPLIVTRQKDGYELIAGERRLKAAKACGFKTVPAVTRDASTQQKLEVSLVENLQRQDLNPIDEALAYQRLINEFHLTQEQVAKKIGKARASVGNTLRLLALPEEIQLALIEGRLSSGHAKVILSLTDPKEQLACFKKIVQGKLTVRDAEKEVRRIAGREAKIKDQDFVVLEQEEKLREALGTKVRIEKRGKKGRIVIEYYSEEDFKELLNRLTSL